MKNLTQNAMKLLLALLYFSSNLLLADDSYSDQLRKLGLGEKHPTMLLAKEADITKDPSLIKLLNPILEKKPSPKVNEDEFVFIYIRLRDGYTDPAPELTIFKVLRENDLKKMIIGMRFIENGMVIQAQRSHTGKLANKLHMKLGHEYHILGRINSMTTD